MGAPKPWPTRWPEPEFIPFRKEDDECEKPLEDPDYDVTVDPDERPFRLPEDRLVPYSVTWGVTHVCNLHCDHCYDASSHHRADLPTDRAFEVVDRLAEMGISFVAFSGGEPMLRQDLFRIMERCRIKGMTIAMRSNATLITREQARYLADLDIAVVGVSLDGATEHSHDRVRGQGMYRQARDGVQALLAEGIRVTLEVVLRTRTVHQSLQFIAVAENWGVNAISFSALVPQGRAVRLRGEALDRDAWSQVTAELYYASQTSKVSVNPSCALLGECCACVEPNITCDGWITPCYLSEFRLFRLLETDAAAAKSSLELHRAESLNACGRMQAMDRLPGSAPTPRLVCIELPGTALETGTGSPDMERAIAKYSR